MKRHVKACHLKRLPMLLLIANYLCALSHQRLHNQEKISNNKINRVKPERH